MSNRILQATAPVHVLIIMGCSKWIIFL